MPVPLPAAAMEEIQTPLKVIHRILASQGNTNAVESHFSSALQHHWDQVPLLNDVEHVEQLQPGSLVRFRCMIQNMYNPEWFLSEFDHVNDTTGERVRVHAKYTEFVAPPPGFSADHSDATSATSERTPLHCMSIPHESDWVKTQLASPIKFQAPVAVPDQRKKRTLGGGSNDDMTDSNNADADADMQCDGDAIEEESKRSRLATGSASSTINENALNAGNERCGSGCDSAGPSGRPALVQGVDARHAAIVKVYYPEGADGHHKVNEAVEFLGVLWLDPEAAAFPGGCLHSAEDLGEELPGSANCGAGQSAPTSLLPRIHAVLHRRLGAPAWNPALQRLPEGEQEARREEVGRRAGELRERVVGALTGALGGDALAAEYCLMHLLSRVSARPHGAPVGALSLAIAGFAHSAAGAAPSAQRLVETLQALHPAVGYQPMTTKALGAAAMVPKKDYDTETLHSGALQLAPGTELVLDQTTMEPGQLNETAVRNMSALQALATHQLLPFDFGFYNVEFPMDVAVLVVSEGKPLIHVDCLVKLQPDAQLANPDALGQLAPEELDLCRTLVGLARCLDVELPGDVCAMAENHFVSARQADPKVDQDTLARWLTLARLQAASRGESSVSAERWQQVLAMEATCQARLASA